MRDEVFLLGRILFALIFVGSGVGKLTDTESSVAYANSKKLPNADLMVKISAVCMLAGGAAVILGIWMDLAAALLAILVLIIAFMMHRFWEQTDEMAKQTEMSMFMKNLSIAGGGFILAAFAKFAPYTITDGVF